METDTNDIIDNQNIQNDYKSLVKNSFYSYLNTYASFFFSLVHTFLLARLISQNEWSYFIIAISYINIISLILSFLPPGLGTALDYYATQFYSLNQKAQLKKFIINSIFLKIIFLIPIFILSIFIFYLLGDLFAINLTNENLFLLFLLSPVILISGLNIVFNSMNRIFNKFKNIFYLLLFHYSINIGSLIIAFLFFESIGIFYVALINILSSFFPFLVNLIINLVKILKIKEKSNSSTSFKDDFQKVFKYGSLARLGYFITDIWGEIQIQSISIFELPRMVLGFNISKRYLSISTNTTISISSPLTISFTGLITKKKKNTIMTIYNLLVRYILFLFLLLTGILYLFSEFFLFFLYGENYLIYSDLVKIYLFSFIFLIFSAPFDSLMLAEKKIKYFNFIRLFAILIRLPVFIILLINNGLIIAIYGLLICNFIYGCLYIYFTFKFGKIRLNLKKILLQYFSFFMSLGIIILLENLILDTLNLAILRYLNLPYFKHLNILALILFLIIFFTINVILKIFTRIDIENIQILLIKDKNLHKIANKALNLFKRFLRS